jgi:hypothetical protein
MSASARDPRVGRTRKTTPAAGVPSGTARRIEGGPEVSRRKLPFDQALSPFAEFPLGAPARAAHAARGIDHRRCPKPIE